MAIHIVCVSMRVFSNVFSKVGSIVAFFIYSKCIRALPFERYSKCIRALPFERVWQSPRMTNVLLVCC